MITIEIAIKEWFLYLVSAWIVIEAINSILSVISKRQQVKIAKKELDLSIKGFKG